MTTTHVRCIVENSVMLSSPLRGEHGVAFHIETPAGQVIFDTGASGEAFLHNAGHLGVDLAQIDALAISHAHGDHTGGLPSVLPHLREGIPLYANADLFRERYTLREGTPRYIGIKMTADELAQHVTLQLNDTPAEIIPGVWTSGEIVERPWFEGRSDRLQARDGDELRPDAYRDDLSLIVETPGGLVVVCGCCHAGLLNTLNHVKQHFEQAIIAVIGGTHLASATDENLALAVEQLRTRYNTPRLYLNHCTGDNAFMAMARAFGDLVQRCPAGTALAF